MESAREMAPDLSLRDDAVATLGGLILDDLVPFGLAPEARTPCRTPGRSVAAVRVGGAMVVEDGAPLLRGADRLESRMKSLMVSVRIEEEL